LRNFTQFSLIVCLHNFLWFTFILVLSFNIFTQFCVIMIRILMENNTIFCGFSLNFLRFIISRCLCGILHKFVWLAFIFLFDFIHICGSFWFTGVYVEFYTNLSILFLVSHKLVFIHKSFILFMCEFYTNFCGDRLSIHPLKVCVKNHAKFVWFSSMFV
jgi:hypothetical protein